MTLTGRLPKGDNSFPSSPPIIEKLRRKPIRQRTYDAPVLCTGCGMKTEPDIRDSMKFTFSEIQLATNDYSKDNLLGEGGYGYVYKGRLKDGQFIAAKVRKEASSQGFSEFQSEIYVLSFARHKNIVMLLGYCCKENVNILVYEYICNRSLEWHLFGEWLYKYSDSLIQHSISKSFLQKGKISVLTNLYILVSSLISLGVYADNTEHVLEWHRRHAIAIGTAKGLRFLHEECRGSPIIHRDMRPSNVLLTHDYVPMVSCLHLLIQYGCCVSYGITSWSSCCTVRQIFSYKYGGRTIWRRISNWFKSPTGSVITRFIYRQLYKTTLVGCQSFSIATDP